MFTGPKEAKVYIVFDFPFREGPTSFASGTLLEAYRLLLANGINPHHCRMAYAFAPKVSLPMRFMSDYMLEKVGEVKEKGGITFHRKLAIPANMCVDIPTVRADIASTPRDLVICFGMLAAQVLDTSHKIDSQHKWRGSMLDAVGTKRAMVTLSPTDWMVDYAKKFLVQHDIRRAVAGLGSGWPRLDYKFVVADPSLASVAQHLAPAQISEKLSVDIETAAGIITSIAIAWSETEAVCIPFVKGEMEWYFDDPLEEARVIHYLARLLMAVPSIGQNYNYDRQYFAAQWGIAPQCIHDTMGGQHVLFNSSLGKDLATLASLHCKDYIFWKDESKARLVGDGDDHSQWIYNCKDAAYTFEIAESQVGGLISSGLYFQFMAFMRSFENAFQTMLKGTRFDNKRRWDMLSSAEQTIAKYDAILHQIVPPDIHQHPATSKADWFDSNTTLPKLFYVTLGQQPNFSKSKTWTTDEPALLKVADREPILAPLVRTILDRRHIDKAVNTYLRARVDNDSRMRTMYQVAGPNTYRLASQKTAYDTGLNLQTLSSGKKHEDKKHNPWGLPHEIESIKQLFVPDPDYYICDVDLEQADARVVAWDSQCKYLMDVFNTPGADLHTANAQLIWGDPTIDKKHHLRQRAKAGVHAVNYCVMADTLSRTLGISITEAQAFIDAWFLKNPEIKAWHEKTEWMLTTKGYVENVFGYRRYFLDRSSKTLLSEAVAWSPQSTVAIYINLVWDKIVSLARQAGLPIFVLLQVHDSLVIQFPRVHVRPALQIIKRAFEDTVCPYTDSPLIIAAGKPEISLKSWGDCKTVNWDLSQS